MLSANFKPKTTATASRGSLATARLSCFCYYYHHHQMNCRRLFVDVSGGQSARVPTAHTPGSKRFLLANNDDDYADFMRYVNSITNVLLTLNSAVNFLIYCLLGKKFRRIFMDMYCSWMPCYRRHRRPSSVDQSDIKLVTGRRTSRTSNLTSRVVSGEDGQQQSSRRWSLTPKNRRLLEVPGVEKEVNYRSAPSLLMSPQSQPSSPCRIDVHV